MRSILVAAAVSLSAAVAHAAAPVTIGVFLPTTIGDSQARYDFSQKLAESLGKSSGLTVTAQNFAKYPDFLAAITKRKIDVAVVDGFIAAQMGDKYKPLAAGVIKGNANQRWAVVAKGSVVARLEGKKLAVVHGAGSDGQFINNVIFGGDYAGDKHFKISQVPTIDSGLKAYEIKSVDAVLVPESLVPARAQVVYRSEALPIATVLAVTSRPELATAFDNVGAVAPFEKFSSASLGDLASLKKLLVKGPPPRIPFLANAPSTRPDTHALVTFKGIESTLPSFLDYMPVSKETPDD